MAEDNNEFITIVSGLPRSGTSMMMRMLDKAGIPILSDGIRKADDDNPLGYYEFEPVKRLGKEFSWLPEAHGKAVKIIYIFLDKLPSDHQYRVIFMRRNLEEVIASQKTMLKRREEAGRLSDQQLIDAYTEQLTRLELWMKRQPNFQVHYLEYHDVVGHPAAAAAEIAAFLGLPLDTRAMAAAVDPSLHRNRSTVS